MEVVTPSGVTSGGMVTSGTTCWTWSQLGFSAAAHIRHEGLFDERGDDGRLSYAIGRVSKIPLLPNDLPSPTSTILTKSRLGIIRDMLC